MFADPVTDDQIGEDDGRTVAFDCTQMFSPEQIEWFRKGSALNIIRARQAGG
jgi:aconitate hydratase